MRADQIHVAVRPRGILECLDLAVMFCGRRPLAVIVATALGSLPCILVNRLLFGWRAGEGLALPGFFLLGLEAAWASVPLTLYLGQAVFSERFSWRAAIRSLLGSLPALVFFQAILRAICLAVVFLSPVVFVGMYYLNQVILLERPPLTRTWRRRTAINRRQSGHVLTLAILDAVILVVGVPLATGLLGAVSAVWRGRPVTWTPGVGADGSPLTAVFTWHGQIAFWSICGFLTVFRFFTYLDARIRREGWDVELKLRADATYAGLAGIEAEPQKPVASRRPARVAGWLTACLLAAGAGSAVAETGTASPAGDGARRALTRHSFPWYDAAEDRYRPLIRPAAEEAKAADGDRGRTGGSGARGPGSRSGSGSGSGAGSGSRRGVGDGTGGEGIRRPRPPSFSLPSLDLGGLGWILTVALFALAALVIIYLVVRYGLWRRDQTAADGDEDDPGDDLDNPGDERLAALPAGVGLATGELLGRAAAHAERGEFEQAMLFFHAWQLVELDRRGGLALARGKTNGQYAAEVTAAAPTLAPLFRRSSRLFEDAFFGDLAVSRADFLAVWEDRDRIASFTRAAGD
jgi:uncharacterized membrane protein YgcG